MSNHRTTFQFRKELGYFEMTIGNMKGDGEPLTINFDLWDAAGLANYIFSSIIENYTSTEIDPFEGMNVPKHKLN